MTLKEKIACCQEFGYPNKNGVERKGIEWLYDIGFLFLFWCGQTIVATAFLAILLTLIGLAGYIICASLIFGGVIIAIPCMWFYNNILLIHPVYCFLIYILCCFIKIAFPYDEADYEHLYEKKKK